MSRKYGDPRHTWAWQKAVARLKAETTEWVCHLCRRPIDPHLPGSHPAGATADHIRPLSLGGLPYDPGNLALAHRHCNLSKGGATGKPRPTTSKDW
jgi:5-methylcytosine-specific restriction endonuclease McrA